MSQIKDTGVTPGRRTVVRLDITETVLVEPPWGTDRRLGQIGTGPQSRRDKVYFVKDVGWKLRAHADRSHEWGELEVAQDTFLLPDFASWSVPSGWEVFRTWRKATDLPQATTGSSGLAVTAGPLVHKRVVDSDNWNAEAYKLTADQTALPSPDTAGDPVVMDRVGVQLTEVFDPDQGLQFLFTVPDIGNVPLGSLVTVYFNGPAGHDDDATGQGYYALKFRGDGTMRLYERGTTIDFDGTTHPNEWVHRGTWPFAPKQTLRRSYHSIRIVPYPYQRAGNSIKGAIAIHAGYVQLTSVQEAVADLGASSLTPWVIYRPPQKAGFSPATQKEKVRVDVRRDLRIGYVVAKDGYQTSGTLIDDPIPLGFFPTEATPLRIEWYGHFPDVDAETPVYTIVATLHDGDAATHAELVPIGSGDIGKTGKYKEYTVPFGQRNVIAKFEFAGDSNRSASLTSYRVVRDGYFEPVAPGEFEMPPTGWSISGGEGDPDMQSAKVSLVDMTGSNTVLPVRAGMPISIETTYHASPAIDWTDPANDKLRAKLHRGYVLNAAGRRKGNNLVARAANLAWPNRYWKKYEVTAGGAWVRLHEQLAPERFDMAVDPRHQQPDDQVVPYKVTDILQAAFEWAGFLSTEYDIPDSEIRFWPTFSEEALSIYPFDNLADFIKQIAYEYLGKFLWYDANAGDVSNQRGKWRLRKIPTAPYTNLASFVTTGPGVAKAMPMHLPSYYVGGDPLALPATAPIVKGSLETWTQPPEANLIVVHGVGLTFPGGWPTQQRLVCSIPNYRSYNFAGLATSDPNYPDPTDPDFLGRIVKLEVMDPTACTEGAVRWVARRLFDLAAHGIKRATFTAPLVLVLDTSDTHQYTPRPLAPGDPVLIDGTQWIIRDCNPVAERDHVQMAVYSVQAPNAVMEY